MSQWINEQVEHLQMADNGTVMPMENGEGKSFLELIKKSPLAESHIAWT